MNRSPDESTSTAQTEVRDLFDWIRSVDKADLHLHLLGAIRPGTAIELARKNKVSLTFGEADWLDTFATGGLARFVEGFIELFPLLKSAEDFERVAWEMSEDLKSDGVVYAEPRVTLTSHLSRGVRPEDIATGLSSAARQASNLLGVDVHWVIDFPRVLGIETGRLALHHAAEGMRWGVVGFDIAGYEPEQANNLVFNGLFHDAKEAGLKLTAHAGEIGPASHVRHAVNKWKVDRIGHGIRSIDDLAVMDLLRERRIPLEISPTSNIRLGATLDWQSHPLDRLRSADVAIILCTDDPTLFGVTLSEEIAQAATVFGWDRTTVEKVIQNGWDFRFVQ